MWASGDRPSRDVAVLDVGSNSVRLVMYRLEGRAIWTVFNEKVLAGLGRSVGETGALSPEGVTAAMSALRRFHAVLDGSSSIQVFSAATAAVRQAKDGPAFVARVRAETGLDIRVLSGEEEAHFSALGVAAGQPDANGVVGDLGGSSLELVRIAEGLPGPGVTLPLGPFALGAPAPIEPLATARAIRARLARCADAYTSDTFYAVGGAWRNIALIHMEATGYPLRIVHQYEMGARDALDAARFVAQQSRASLERMPGVSKKRAETLPYAALVLEALVETLQLQRVCFSAYGLREGLLLDAMSPELRAQDPLVEGCAALGARMGASDSLGPALEDWLRPLWTALPPLFEGSPPRDALLLAAACRLADLGARLHPDHRADLAFDQVLRAPIAGQSHPERAYLAAAVFSRHTSQVAIRPDSGLARVLTPERLTRARALGAAMRLACDLSGRSETLLAVCSLELRDGVLTLTLKPGAADLLLGEQTRKRLSALAGVLGCGHRIESPGA
ncbi:Ppx/GppA family phosphatase [Caulobacter sp. S45]|uniref:Ppx/GppA family phosphatase n=1 Tax=Caulobacter sp. S45 TaxID=1641861 RepID=UPI00131B7E05|nr:Ppx/GppA family phosphatase [Caulobacter sp. S45]